MRKKIISAVATSIIFAAAALPVIAQDSGSGTSTPTTSESGTSTPPTSSPTPEQPKKEKLFKMVAKVKEVDLTNKVLKLRKKGVTVDASNALVVSVDLNGAKVGSLADLKPGEQIFLVVKKEKGKEKKMTAHLILRGLKGGVGGSFNGE